MIHIFNHAAVFAVVILKVLNFSRIFVNILNLEFTHNSCHISHSFAADGKSHISYRR